MILASLLLGGLTTVIAMAIQVAAVVIMIRYLIRVQAHPSWMDNESFVYDTLILITVLMVLFTGHLVQISIWAALFVHLGEFSDFQTALYHSTVNFTSLGYGDIVMSRHWRLLGALETANGVLMFGLSTATLFAIMSRLFSRHRATGDRPDRG